MMAAAASSLITIFISTRSTERERDAGSLGVFVFSLSTTYLNKIITIIPAMPSLSLHLCARGCESRFSCVRIYTGSVISFFSDVASATNGVETLVT
jgi:hypothetical protein